VLASSIADEAEAREHERFKRSVMRLARGLERRFQMLHSLIDLALPVKLRAGIIARVRLLPYCSPAQLVHLEHCLPSHVCHVYLVATTAP
jgi:hypothetical protein